MRSNKSGQARRAFLLRIGTELPAERSDATKEDSKNFLAKFPALSLYMSEARVMPHIRVANPANRTSVGLPTHLNFTAGRMPQTVGRQPTQTAEAACG